MIFIIIKIISIKNNDGDDNNNDKTISGRKSIDNNYNFYGENMCGSVTKSPVHTGYPKKKI